MDKRKVIYYTDELNDEFSTARITPKKIDANYVYCHGSAFKRFTHFFWYRVIFTPIAFLYTKIILRQKIIGAEKFKECKDMGYFIYGNHTQPTGDAFMPNMINFPRTNYVIVHPSNVSMPFLGKITPSLGALPLPDDMSAYKNFLRAIEQRIREGNSVVIYPEAHIWPFYTEIRPFKDDSFQYPVRLGVPTFCFTNTYQKRRSSKKPRIVTYVDGPFYADASLPPRTQRKELRDKVYAAMRERAKNSNVIQIKYVKVEHNKEYE